MKTETDVLKEFASMAEEMERLAFQRGWSWNRETVFAHRKTGEVATERDLFRVGFVRAICQVWDALEGAK